VKRSYNITPEAVSRAKLRFRDALAKLDRALEGQEYFTGSDPCRADITVAALLAPLCRPPEHPVAWPELPQALRDFTRDFEQSRTWQHVLAMYRKHRWPAT
jgi:glutathione S-transferase